MGKLSSSPSLEYIGILQRIASVIVVTLASSYWQSLGESRVSRDLIWPPSPKSAPNLGVIILIFIFLVKRTFFSGVETAESKRVQDVKRRLVLAQMNQALLWDVDEGNEDEENKESEDEKKVKRPPFASDLFEMLYDDIEERHVTEYNILAHEEPYVSTLALFKERLSADFRDYVMLTQLARREANDDAIDCTDSGLDDYQVKRIPEFRDGTKLSELLTLYRRKIQKAFGKHILDEQLLKAAEACRDELAKEQRKGIKMLWPALRPVLPTYLFSLCLMTFDASNGTVVYHSMKTLLDKVGTGDMSIEELKVITFQTYIGFGFCVFAHLTAWAFTHKATADFRLKIRNSVMANMIRQDMKFFDFYPSGLLQERLNNDAEQLSSKLFHLPLRLLESFCRLLSCVIMLYSMHPKFFYVVIIPIPIISVCCNFIIRYMRTLGQRQRKIGEHVAANTMEVLKEIRTVREFCMEGEEADKFAASSAYRAEIEQYASAMHHIILISPLCCLFEGMRFFCTYLGGTFVVSGELTVGQAVMAAGLAGDMTHILRSFFDIIPEIVQILQPLGRVCDMLSAKPRIEPIPGSEPKLKPEKFMGAIEFRNVDFTFPSEPLKQVLFGLSWSIAPGEKVGFTGSTGCGKSTSLYLIQRMYNPQRGSILLDGRDIGDYDVHHLRRHMSVVSQVTCLFSTTIRENIVYGLPRETRESISDLDIETALRQANAWKFVNEFPRKLETYAGERGVKMSGGQKQRLAIARAIIRKPTIILLDEATAALDSKAEVVVQEALDKITDEHANGCTLVVAHRLSTLKACDRILVMDKGSIKEAGSHDQLMKYKVEKDSKGNMVKGWYRDLYETQHGSNRSEEIEDLKRQVEMMEQKCSGLKEENSILKGETIKAFKLGKVRRRATDMPTLLPLLRQSSDNCDTLRFLKESCPPPLDLNRAKTTFDW
jgi:ABC-type multidrug transport system fused ATPase/permease subunit